VRPFTEELPAHRRHALQLAAEADEVEVGLGDFALAPEALQPECCGGLGNLAKKGTPATALAVLVEQAGQLHRQRAGAAGRIAAQVAPGRLAGGSPIHAVVYGKVAVFGKDHRPQQGR